MLKIDHTGTPAAAEYATVHLVFELSKAKWKLGITLPESQKMSRYTIDGGDLPALSGRLAAARSKAERSGKPVRIVACYEAGLDGHWLHHWLTEQGVISYEVDPSSIEVSRREPRVCSMVHVPTVEEEDRKRRTRERERLLKERIAHTNRIKGLLFGQGIRGVMPLKPGFVAGLAKLRTGDGRELPPRLREEIVREHERLCLVAKQLSALEAQSQTELRTAVPGSAAAKINQLIEIKGIGAISGQELVHEAFYRSFDNRRQVGSYFGLAGTPYDSGESRREQGISKAGNRRARELAIELAWLWLRHQPGSELSRWFHQRVGDMKGRIRRITIVAVARKLMVALWHYLTTGVVPTGAVLHPSL
jgi:transposase